MRLLVLGALIGAPIAFVAYFYLRFVGQAQTYVFSTLPHELGFSKAPAWWPIAPLLVGGLIVALAVTYLPGTGGHKPAEGFHTGGGNEPINLPGIVVCSLATLCLGAVLGPEAPLIAIGGGLGVLAIHLVNKDAPPMAAVVIGGAGSFAAIATLLRVAARGRVLVDGGGRRRRSRCWASFSFPGCWPPASEPSSSSASIRGPASGPSA